MEEHHNIDNKLFSAEQEIDIVFVRIYIPEISLVAKFIQALAPKGFLFAPATKNESFGRVGARQEQIFFTQFSLLRWFCCTILSQENVGKPTKPAVNAPAKYIFCLKN